MQFSDRHSSLVLDADIAQISSLIKVLLGFIAIGPHHGFQCQRRWLGEQHLVKYLLLGTCHGTIPANVIPSDDHVRTIFVAGRRRVQVPVAEVIVRERRLSDWI